MVYFTEERITTGNVKKMNYEIFQLIAQTKEDEFIVDMSNTTYISSAVLRTFLIIKKTLDNKMKKLKVIHVNDYCKKIFEMTGFDQFLIIE